MSLLVEFIFLRTFNYLEQFKSLLRRRSLWGLCVRKRERERAAECSFSFDARPLVMFVSDVPYSSL